VAAVAAWLVSLSGPSAAFAFLDHYYGSIQPDGAPVTVSTLLPDDTASVTFEATAGQRISLSISGVTYSGGGNCCTRARITREGGGDLVSTPSFGRSYFVDTKVIGTTGTYRITVDPEGTRTVDARLTLYDVASDASGTIATDAGPVSIGTTDPGQDARLTFSGTAGQRVSLIVDSVAFGGGASCCVSAGLQDRLGNPLPKGGTSLFGTNGAFIGPTTLPATDTYTILWDPYEGATASARFRLYDVPPDVVGTISPDGSATSTGITAPGQKAILEFGGVAGRRVSLVASGLTYSSGSCCAQVQVNDAADNQVAGTGTNTFGSGVFSESRDPLAATGTYRLVLDPYEAAVVTAATFRLYQPQDVSVTVNPAGPAGSFTLDGRDSGQTSISPAQRDSRSNSKSPIHRCSGTSVCSRAPASSPLLGWSCRVRASTPDCRAMATTRSESTRTKRPRARSRSGLRIP
jgi:hypothetical protein